MIDICLRILDQNMMYYKRVTDFPNPKNPALYRSYISETELKSKVKNDVQFFDVSNIHPFATYLSDEIFLKDDNKNSIPADAKFPSKNFCFFSSIFEECEIGQCIYCFHVVDNCYEVFGFDSTGISCLGVIDLENKKMDCSYVVEHTSNPKALEISLNILLKLVTKYLISTSIILTNQEITTKSAAGIRQQKKAAAKRHKINPDRWSKICWNVQEPTQQFDKNSDQIIRHPLHFTRGHWRKALESHPKSIQRPSAINEKNRLLWWTWIDGYWSGHPAYGFKKSVYQPEIKNLFAK
jgi:hypothetical protein|tara:strand:- start:75 stop:959 length:885 start_codon:yes stop_codon:yes gene_type:complete